MTVSVVVTVLLWSVVATLATLAASRVRLLLSQGLRNGALEFLHTLPRIILGVIGSGYLAAAMPQDALNAALGRDSGLSGVALATIAGALTPGGAVVGFAIGATALKAGAGGPQVIAYSLAWALFALQRIISWEVPMMPSRVVWLRAAVSLPMPFLAAMAAMLLDRP